MSLSAPPSEVASLLPPVAAASQLLYMELPVLTLWHVDCRVSQCHHLSFTFIHFQNHIL